MPHPHLRSIRTLAVVLGLALVATGCGSSTRVSASAPPAPTADPPVATPSSPVALSLLHVAGGARPAFVDAQGRQVLLRGVNLNSLGDYYQARPDRPQVVPVADADWGSMATLGLSVVRLIVSWSFLEPSRGRFDPTYLAKVKAAVAEAKRHGLYVVLDMHQDAWGKYIATPAGTHCPAGTEPNAGWDGAPKWATITDGKSTCRAPGNRESAPAVQAAFTNFYANRDGIQDEFVHTWMWLASAFAKEPAVAGYDLLNEPNVVGVPKTTIARYTALLARTIRAIRVAEQAGEGSRHIVFYEPLLLFPLPDMTPPPGFTPDRDIAFAPHNYWESITNGVFTVEQGFDVDAQAAKGWGVPYWIGEYGWWDTSKATVAKLHRNAVAEDRAFGGSTWWQWKQACGDPHGLSTPAATPPTSVVQLNTLSCPGDHEVGLTAPFAALVSRAYPRTAPGRLTSLVSDYDHRRLRLTGSARGAARGARLQVWVPKTAHAGVPQVGGAGLGAVRVTAVPGGWIVSAQVACSYSLTIDLGSVVTGPLGGCG